MGITNFVSRPFAGLATIVTEYTDSPLNFVLAFAVSSIFVVKNIKGVFMSTTVELPVILLPARIEILPLVMLTLLMLLLKSVTYKIVLVLSIAIPLGADTIYESTLDKIG